LVLYDVHVGNHLNLIGLKLTTIHYLKNELYKLPATRLSIHVRTEKINMLKILSQVYKLGCGTPVE